MRTVLSLDPGDATGWALYHEGSAKPRAGVASLPDVDKNIGRWSNAFRDWLVPFARLENVTDIVSEAPIIVMHGGSPDINVVIKHVAILICASMCADELGLPQVCRASRSTVSKHFTALVPGQKQDNGERIKRKQLKAAFIVTCQGKGWNIISEDMADALGTLDWFCHDRGIKTAWDSRPAAGPLFAPRGVTVDQIKAAGASQKFLNKATSFERDRTKT